MNEDIIQESLRAHLAAYGPLADLVGQRIYADQIPENAPRPAMAIFRISRTEGQSKLGRANYIDSLMQITISGDEKGDVRKAADALRDALLPPGGYRGPMGAGPFVVEVLDITSDNEADLFDHESQLYYRHCDYTITHRYKG